jgi:hypothetical protein
MWGGTPTYIKLHIGRQNFQWVEKGDFLEVSTISQDRKKSHRRLDLICVMCHKTFH